MNILQFFRIPAYKKTIVKESNCMHKCEQEANNLKLIAKDFVQKLQEEQREKL